MAKRVTHLVVDSSAFIRQAPLHKLTDTAYTVEEVVKEIRDTKTRESLNVLLYDLKFKEPSMEALRFVTNYSKKTGDYGSLSAVDLRLLAVTYQLYQENVGVENLNLEPKQNGLVNSETTFGNKGIKLAGFVYPKKDILQTDQNEQHSNVTCDNSDLKSETEPKNNNTVEEQEEEEEEEEVEDDDAESFTTAVDDEHNISNLIAQVEIEQNDDDKDDGWITPSNIKVIRSKLVNNGETVDDNTMENLPVACITTDFSMQNVLIQLGIPVLSVDGLLIRTARSYVLKCHVCSGVTLAMTKRFCPECGNPTLQRASVTVDSDGKRHYHVNGRFRPKPRESLPLPRGGKHSNNPIRVEDQPRPQNRPTKKSLMKRNVLDDDYLADSSPFSKHDIYSRAALLGIKQNSRR